MSWRQTPAGRARGLGAGRGRAAAVRLSSSVNSGLAHLWGLGESSGSRLDSAGAVPLAPTGTVPTGAGVAGGLAALLDGGDGNYLSASDAGLPAGAAARSVAFWFRWDGTGDGAYKFVFSYGTAALDRGFYAGLSNATAPALPRLFVSQYGLNVTGVTGVAAGVWHHAAVTVEPTAGGAARYCLYLDGTLDTFGDLATDTLPGGAARVGPAPGGVGLGFPGLCQQVAVWSRPLTPPEVGYLGSRFRPHPFYRVSGEGVAADLHPVPASVYADLADAGAGAVSLPADRTVLAADQLLVARPDVTLRFAGATLARQLAALTGTTNWRPVEVAAPDVATPAGATTRYVHHATGAVTAATASLTLHEWPTPPPAPGDRFVAVLGVGTGDVLWGEYTLLLEVADFEDHGDGTATLTTADPIGVDVTVWPSEAALDAAKSNNSEPAVGPWGQPYPPPGTAGTMPMSWGLGTDHGLIFFAGGQPVSGVTVTGGRFEVSGLTPATAAGGPDGGALVWLQHAAGAEVGVAGVAAAPVFAVMLRESFDCRVTLGGVSGAGVSRIFASNTTACALIAVAGGGGHTIEVAEDITGTGWTLYTSELGPRDVTVRFAPGVVFSAAEPVGYDAPPPYTQVQAYWSSPGTRFEGLTFAVPVYLTDSNVAPDVTFEDLTLAGGLRLGDAPGNTYYLPLNRFVFEGTLAVEGDSWSAPPVNRTATLGVSFGASPRAASLAGLHRRARFRVTDPGGLTGVLDGHGNDYTAAALAGGWVTPTALHPDVWCALPPTGYSPGVTGYELYRSRTALLFHGVGAAATVEFDSDTMLEVGAGSDQWQVA